MERPGEPRSLAEKLDHLFAQVRAPGGKEYSNEQVASAIARTGVSISQSYIWQLRKSKKDNPTMKHVQALADFFAVPAAYFFDDDVADGVDRQLDAIKAERAKLDEITGDSDVQLMAMRAGELSPPRRKQVMDMLEVVYRLEQAERGSGTNE